MSKNLFLILILLPFLAWSQKDTVARIHTFGSIANDVAEDVAITHDGGIILIGSTASSGDGNTDIYILKTDSMCNREWSYAIGGNNNDWGYAIKQTFDKGFIIAASSNSYGNGGYDAMLLKRDSVGNYQWQKTYGNNDWDFAYDVVQTFDSGYVFCGETYNNTAGFSDVYVVKTNSIGDTLWTKTIGGSLADKGNSLMQTADSNIVVAGLRNTQSDSTQAYVLKFDKDGILLWDSTFGGSKFDVANSIIETNDGNYVFIGTTNSFDTTNNDYYIVKISTNGSLIWQNYLSIINNEEAFDIYELSNSNLLFVAQTNTFGGGKTDVHLVTLTSSGFWAAKASTFGSTEMEIPTGLAVNSNGIMYISGYTNSFGKGLNDLMVIKVDTITKNQQYTFTENEDLAPISVNELGIKNFSINIYPNPAKKTLHINSSKYPVNIQLIDILGKPILERKIHKQLTNIDISSFPNGFYSLIFLENELVIDLKKIIIAN